MFSSWRAEFDKKSRILHVQLAALETRKLDGSSWLQRYKLGKILLNDLVKSVVHFSMVSADVSTGPA